MSLPTPAVPLDGCSTIYNNTLYTYSPNAFQALPLNQGAKWEKLPGGVSVTGGVCVQAPDALYIVGGTAAPSEVDYQGVQKYVFGAKSWETLAVQQSPATNRVYHNAIYLAATSSIFIYAGSQDGWPDPNSGSFTISTVPPYTSRSFPSTNAPAVSPMILTWSDSTAAVLGGSDSNTKVMLFTETDDPAQAWTDSMATLGAPLKSDGSMQTAIVSADDNSKSLFTFDMSRSPNVANRILLVNQNGTPMTNAQPVKARMSNEARELVEKATLTAGNWPAYNSSLAPMSTRTQYSLAQDSNGLIVISGGNTDDVLCMFNARENSWENATALLGAKSQVVIGTHKSSSVSSTSTASKTSSVSTATSASTVPTSSETPSPSPTAAAVAAASSGLSRRTLGIIIGSVLGFIVVVIALILCIRRSRKKRQFVEAGHQRRASGIPDEKDPMDFADRGMRLEPTSRRYQGHVPNESHASFSSMAILMGKVGHTSQAPTIGRRNGSNASTASSDFNKQYKSTISKPIPQVRSVPPATYARAERPPVVGGSNPGPTPRPRGNMVDRQGSTRRSSGWNRYWSGGSALNVLGFGNKRTTYGSQSDQGSVYSDANHSARGPQKTDMVPPLNFGAPPARMSLSHVASGSPTIAHQAKGSPLEQGMSGTIERPHSVSSISSYGDLQDTFSGGMPTHGEQKTWTPMDNQGWNSNRVPSSLYTDSEYNPTPRQTIVGGNNDGYPEPRRNHMSHQHSTDMSWLNLGENKH